MYVANDSDDYNIFHMTQPYIYVTEEHCIEGIEQYYAAEMLYMQGKMDKNDYMRYVALTNAYYKLFELHQVQKN